MEFKKRQAELDEAAANDANERRGCDDGQIPEEPLEAIAAEQFRPLKSLKELTGELIDHFSRFKPVWRQADPEAVNYGGLGATYWLIKSQNPRS